MGWSGVAEEAVVPKCRQNRCCSGHTLRSKAWLLRLVVLAPVPREMMGCLSMPLSLAALGQPVFNMFCPQRHSHTTFSCAFILSGDRVDESLPSELHGLLLGFVIPSLGMYFSGQVYFTFTNQKEAPLLPWSRGRAQPARTCTKLEKFCFAMETSKPSSI